MKTSAIVISLFNLALFSGQALAEANPLPEPGALHLLAVGAIAAGAMWLKNRKK